MTFLARFLLCIAAPFLLLTGEAVAGSATDAKVIRALKVREQQPQPEQSRPLSKQEQMRAAVRRDLVAGQEASLLRQADLAAAAEKRELARREKLKKAQELAKAEAAKSSALSGWSYPGAPLPASLMPGTQDASQSQRFMNPFNPHYIQTMEQVQRLRDDADKKKGPKRGGDQKRGGEKKG